MKWTSEKVPRAWVEAASSTSTSAKVSLLNWGLARAEDLVRRAGLWAVTLQARRHGVVEPTSSAASGSPPALLGLAVAVGDSG
jgi:hypothetical protein